MEPALRSLFIICRDLNRSRSFYQSLGFRLQKEKSRSLVFSVGRQVELHLHEPLLPKEEQLFGLRQAPASPSLVHSFVVENLDSLVANLDTASILFGPDLTEWGDRILLLKDPDGHRLEFREGSI